MKQNNLLKLLTRGDEVSVVQGQLRIIPFSEKPVPDWWLASHESEIVREIGQLTGERILQYLGYSTGRFWDCKYPGVHMQFVDVATRADAYAIFNADLKRQRTTRYGKAGDPLPSGRFSITPNHELFKFWLRAGLPPPRRLSALHDRMGKLGGIFLTGEFTNTAGNKLANKTLTSCNISYASLLESSGIILPCKQRTRSGHYPDISRTKFPDKPSGGSPDIRALGRYSSTGAETYGKK